MPLKARMRRLTVNAWLFFLFFFRTWVQFFARIQLRGGKKNTWPVIWQSPLIFRLLVRTQWGESVPTVWFMWRVNKARFWIGGHKYGQAWRMWVRADRIQFTGPFFELKGRRGSRFEDLSPADLCFGKGAGSAELRNVLKHNTKLAVGGYFAFGAIEEILSNASWVKGDTTWWQKSKKKERKKHQWRTLDEKLHNFTS